MGNYSEREPTEHELIIKQLLGAVRLHKIGNSNMITIPLTFLSAFGEKIDGFYWAKLDQSEDLKHLIITPITMDDVNQISGEITITTKEGKPQ